MTTVAFVSAPGSSIFMRDILEAVAGAVGVLDGVEVVLHDGYLENVVGPGTVGVVVPHEYLAVAGEPSPEVLARTIAFGVEHPGTETFEVSARHAVRMGGWFEIGSSSVQDLAARGHVVEPFPLGYAAAWDRWGGAEVERPIDVTYLGTADPRRSAILAGVGPDLADIVTDLLLPPHEPMLGSRPDFLVSTDKWAHLARSKVMINLHRDGKRALEWVRVLEAMVNGCVVVTEPSTDLGPLVPGRHVVVADLEDIGTVARALVRHPARLARIARSAYDLCRDELSMAPNARALAATAARLDAAAPPAPAAQPASAAPGTWVEAGGAPPLAAWVPAVPAAPVPSDLRTRLTRPDRLTRPRSPGAVPETLDVVCVQMPSDGPWQETLRSLRAGGAPTQLLIGRPGDAEVRVDAQCVVRGSGAAASRGAARNRLVASSRADLVAVVDGGDAFLGDALSRMADRLRADPGIDAVLCLATYGPRRLVNVLPPEERRLAATPYLSRGFVIRRDVLEELGGFVEDDDLSDHLDHELWVSLTRAGGRVEVLRHIGLALWPRAGQRSA